MALTTEEQRLQGIGQLLVLEQLLEKTKAIECHRLAGLEHISLIQYLVKNKILTAEQIALTVAQNFGVPMIDLDCIEVESIPYTLVSDKLIRRHFMLPLFSRGNNLFLATDDPRNKLHSKKFNFIPV